MKIPGKSAFCFAAVFAACCGAPSHAGESVAEAQAGPPLIHIDEVCRDARLRVDLNWERDDRFAAVRFDSPGRTVVGRADHGALWTHRSRVTLRGGCSLNGTRRAFRLELVHCWAGARTNPCETAAPFANLAATGYRDLQDRFLLAILDRRGRTVFRRAGILTPFRSPPQGGSRSVEQGSAPGDAVLVRHTTLIPSHAYTPAAHPQSGVRVRSQAPILLRTDRVGRSMQPGADGKGAR